MRKSILSLFFTTCLLCVSLGNLPGPKKGTPDIKSISQISFNDEGILFIGDSRGGQVFAIDLDDTNPQTAEKAISIADLEGEVGALLGTSAENVLIHDMAVNPVSKNIYISVSRGRAKWSSRWELPNDLEDAVTLLAISPSGEFSEVSLEKVEYSSILLPNPIDEEKEHRWKKGVKQRVDAITDLTYFEGNVYVAGLSNEEFAASMWVTPYPFDEQVVGSTLEIFHGAHGEYETHAPIRTFLPYELNKKSQIIAAYLCTPIVTFDTDKLGAEKHVKGRTVAEFGSGNYPLDMVSYQNNGKDYVLMSNSQLPLIIFDPADIESYEGEIVTEVDGYTAGISYTARSGTGIQQLADFDDKYIVATQRMANGKLGLISLSKEWLIP